MKPCIFVVSLLYLIPLTGLDLAIIYEESMPQESDEMSCTPPTAREEKTLFSEINQESRRLYNSLDCVGKRRTLELSKRYDNKNRAVQDAAKEMGQRQRMMYRNGKKYERRIEQEGGQLPYNKYGN